MAEPQQLEDINVIPGTSNYPSEKNLSISANLWFIFSSVWIYLSLIFSMGIGVFRLNKCELEEANKSIWLNSLWSTFIFIVMELLFLFIIMTISDLWYKRIRLFGIPKVYILFNLINTILFIGVIILLVVSSCDNSNKSIIYSALSYRIFVFITFICILCKYPHMTTRLVWKQSQLRLFDN